MCRHHSDDEERRSKKKSRRHDRSRSRSRSKSRSARPRGEGAHHLLPPLAGLPACDAWRVRSREGSMLRLAAGTLAPCAAAVCRWPLTSSACCCWPCGSHLALRSLCPPIAPSSLQMRKKGRFEWRGPHPAVASVSNLARRRGQLLLSAAGWPLAAQPCHPSVWSCRPPSRPGRQRFNPPTNRQPPRLSRFLPGAPLWAKAPAPPHCCLSACCQPRLGKRLGVEG